jgi:hypothetical protein
MSGGPSRRRALLLIGVLVVAGAACSLGRDSSNGTSSAVPPVVGAPPEAAAAALIRARPIVDLAEAQLVDRCLRQDHLRYPGYPRLRAQRLHPPTGLFGAVLSLSFAEHHGYGPRVGAGWSKLGAPTEQRYLMRLTESARRRYWTDLFGPSHQRNAKFRDRDAGVVFQAPTQGCFAQARRELFGSVGNWLFAIHVPEAILRRAELRAEGNQTLLSARRAYASCMATSGYVVETPGAALESASGRFNDRPRDGIPSPPELDMAITDAQCQIGAGYASAVHAAISEASGHWMHSHRKLALRVLVIQRNAGSVARKVVDGGG